MLYPPQKQGCVYRIPPEVAEIDQYAFQNCNGSVIATRYNWDRMMQTVTDQYRGWKLQDIYTGNGGVVGLTMDGKLVGDGIYENVDFSVFDK